MIAKANLEFPGESNTQAARQSGSLALTKLAGELEALFRRRDAGSVAVRYAIGFKALAARLNADERNEVAERIGSKRRGRLALQTLADMIGRSRRTLFNCSKVAGQ